MPRREELQPEQVQMTFGDHLEELRRRLLYSIYGLIPIAGLAFYFGAAILTWLKRPLTRAQLDLGLPPQTYSFTALSGFYTYMKVALIAALVLGLPWVLYHLWQFVAQGLYPSERRVVRILAPFSGFMTFLGILFCYYVLLPSALTFLLAFSSKELTTGPILFPYAQTQPATQPFDHPTFIQTLPGDPLAPQHGQLWINTRTHELRTFFRDQLYVIPWATPTQNLPLINLDDYIDFVLLFMLAAAATFQVPVVMLMLGWTRLIDPTTIARARKFVLFGCFFAAAVLTPTPDPINMTILAVPMYLLFELGLLLMRWVYRQRAAAPAE